MSLQKEMYLSLELYSTFRPWQSARGQAADGILRGLPCSVQSASSWHIADDGQCYQAFCGRGGGQHVSQERDSTTPVEIRRS